MEDEHGLTLKLTFLASNTKKKVCGVLNFLISFLRTYAKKNTHNMVSLVLDPRFNNLHILSLFVGRNQHYKKKANMSPTHLQLPITI
jgi:hypothetical protein